MNHFIEEVHSDAKSKGWWPAQEDGQIKPRPSGEVRMLIVSEIAEATEEVRIERPPVYQVHTSLIPDRNSTRCVPPHSDEWNPAKKPEGEAVELADAVIRICDYFGSRGWSLDGHLNDHVGLYAAESPLEHHMQFVEFVARARGADEEKNLGRVVVLIKDYFETKGWNLEEIMRLKIDFNKSRPYRHGNKAH